MTHLLVLNLLLFVALFAAALAVGYRLRKPQRYYYCGVCCAISLPSALYTLYYLHLFDNWAFFYALRSLPVMNFYPGLLGLAAGSLAVIVTPPYRKGAVVILVLPFVVLPFVKQLVSPLDLNSLQDNWAGGVCMQSSPSTCGAASAATLLSELFDQHLHEREVARNAFSCATGTEAWYLAQYLRKLGYEVTFYTHQDKPVVSSIAGTVSGSAGHFVTILHEVDGGYEIADPLNGERWVSSTRVVLWTGFYMRVKKAT